jgi:hypothetical protein
VPRVPLPNFTTLPFAERAVIPEAKLTEYVLNPEHPTGQHKARLFESCLGIRREDWEHLRDQILGGLPTARASTVGAKRWRDEGSLRFGLEFEVHVPVDGLNGQSCEVLTGWMVAGSLVPSFTTGRPLG